MSWASHVALALIAVVAALAVFVLQPPAPQASHATDGEVLAWVESYDGFDASAGLVDAAVADLVPALVAGLPALSDGLFADAVDGLPGPLSVGSCRARAPLGLPAAELPGCEFPKLAADLPEVEPPRVAAGAAGPVPRRTDAVPSDPVPPQAPLQQPLRPPAA